MKRPTFLTIWLSLMTIGNVYTLYQYTLGAAALKLTVTTMPTWALTALALFSLLNVVAVILLWMWKKMGFYLFIGSALLVASVNGAILGILGLAGSFSALIGIGILYLAMRPVWQNFK